jgi:hypothetical protein
MSITLEELKEAIRAVIATEGEDRVYLPQGDQCLYVHTDKDGCSDPGCLIGHALNRLGISLDELSRNEDVAAQDLDFWDSDDTAAFAREIQFLQDDGAPWGHAYRGAMMG